MKKIISIVILIIISLVISSAVLAATGTITTDDLNVRDGASTNANAIGKLSKNETVNIVSEVDGWYKIEYKDGTGYVSSDYVKATEENLQNPESSSSKEVETSNQASVNATTTNKKEKTLLSEATLYALPLLNSSKLATLPENTFVNVISSNGKWVYIQTEKESGWIIASKLTTVSEPETEDDLLPKTESEQKKEETVDTAQNTIAKNETTANTTADSSTESNKTSDSTASDESYPITMKVSADSVNIRKSASTNAEVISGTSKGATVKVIAKEGEWYKVDTEDGIGYIKAELLSK